MSEGKETRKEEKARKQSRKAAIATVGKASQPGTEREQKDVKSTSDIFLSKFPVIKNPKAIMVLLGVHEIRKHSRNKKVMEQHKALQQEYEKLSKEQSPSFGAYYEKARNDVKRQRLERKVESIRKAQERSAKIGRLIGAAAMGAQQMSRLAIQRDTYNSVRADTSGTLRKDLPLISAADNLDDEAVYGM